MCDEITKDKPFYAWEKGGLVNLSGTWLNIEQARLALTELRKAVQLASESPFERWWQSLPADLAGCRYLEQGSRNIVNKEQARKLFDSIRNAK